MTLARVDFFKPSGKWYTAEDVEFSDELLAVCPSPEEALSRALVRRLYEVGIGKVRLAGMWAVCLEPPTKFKYPAMVLVPTEVF